MQKSKLPVGKDVKRSMIPRPVVKSYPESSQSLAPMEKSCARGFFDITSSFDLTSVHYKLDYEQLKKTERYVSIDPSDTEAVATYFRSTYSIPLGPIVEGDSRVNTQLPLGYFFLRDDGSVCYRAMEPPEEKRLDGCCIVLQSVHLSNLTDPRSDATLRSKTNVAPKRLAQIIEGKVCWDRHLNLTDLPPAFLADQFSRFRQPEDGSVTWTTKSESRALKKWEIIALLVDAVDGVPCVADGVDVMSCAPPCGHYKDPDYKYADSVLHHYGAHMILVLLRKPGRSPDTTNRRIFPAEDIDKARAACTAFSNREKRPVFCVLTDLTTRWVIIWNTIGRPGVLGYEASTHGMVYQQEFSPPLELALPMIRGLLRYCITYIDPFYRSDWWSKDDSPNHNDNGDDDGKQEASGKPDADPGVQDRRRRRREFFNVFDIIYHNCPCGPYMSKSLLSSSLRELSK